MCVYDRYVLQVAVPTRPLHSASFLDPRKVSSRHHTSTRILIGSHPVLICDAQLIQNSKSARPLGTERIPRVSAEVAESDATQAAVGARGGH